MKKLLSILVILVIPVSKHAQDVVHNVKLPASKLFVFPNSCLSEDGRYRESYGEGSSLVSFQYRLEDGERTGSLKVFDEEGSLVATGEFRNNRLEDGELRVKEGDSTVTLHLDYAAPTWFFRRHWLARSGKPETDGEDHFVWLAGQRYKLPDDVVRLNF